MPVLTEGLLPSNKYKRILAAFTLWGNKAAFHSVLSVQNNVCC